MKLDILTPEKTLYTGEIRLVSVPGVNGSFEILINHAPIISTLTSGEVRLIDIEGIEKKFAIKGGIIEQTDNKVILLVD